MMEVFLSSNFLVVLSVVEGSLTTNTYRSAQIIFIAEERQVTINQHHTNSFIILNGAEVLATDTYI